MNVDILFEFGSLNGGEQSMLALLPLLRARGVRIRALAPPEGDLASALRSLDFELIPFRLDAEAPFARRQEQLGKVLWKITPNLLHANSVSMARLSGSIVAPLLPSIAHLRDIVRLNRTTVSELNKHRRLLAVSEATRKFHIDQGVYPDLCRVMYNGVDLERFRPTTPDGTLHRELGIPDRAPILTSIGQIGLRKGQNELMDILSPIFFRRPDVHLIFVGRRWSEKQESIRYEEDLRRKAALEPFCGRVRFLGVRDDIPRILNESTLLVHSARQEPLGRVLLEAAACGVPIVAKDVGGTREIFPNERTSAWIVAPDAPEKFREAVDTLLDEREFRDRLGRSARREAETRFSRETAASELHRHYEAVLSGE